MAEPRPAQSPIGLNVSWNGTTISVYPEEGAESDSFFITPLLHIANREADGRPEIFVRGASLSIVFHLYPEEMMEYLAAEIEKWLSAREDARSIYRGPRPVSPSVLLRLPITYLQIGFLGLGDRAPGLAQFPADVSAGVMAPQLDSKIAFHWRCHSDDHALALSSLVENTKVFFAGVYAFRATNVVGEQASLTAQKLVRQNWNSRVSPAGDGLYDTKQFFTLSQIATTLTDELDSIRLEYISDAGYSPVSSQDLSDVMAAFLRQVMEQKDIPWDQLTQFETIYVGPDSFKADHITREAQEVSQAMQSYVDSAVNEWYEDAKAGKAFRSYDNISEELRQHSASGSSEGQYYQYFKGGISGSDSYLKKFRDEVHNVAKDEWCTNLKRALASRLTEQFNSSNSIKYSWEGDRFIPKTFSVFRLLQNQIQKNTSIFVRRGIRLQECVSVPFQTDSQTKAEGVADYFRIWSTDIRKIASLLVELGKRLEGADEVVGS